MTQANLDWINLYRAALKECDAEKRLVRVEEARRAMNEALRLAVEHGDSDQRHSIAEALHHLDMIRKPEK